MKFERDMKHLPQIFMRINSECEEYVKQGIVIGSSIDEKMPMFHGEMNSTQVLEF